MPELHILLKELRPDDALAQRHVWLIHLFDWLRADAANAQAVAVDSARYQALASRIDQLEARMATQDVTMRRVLAMLIDWMEKENQSLAARMRDMRAA